MMFKIILRVPYFSNIKNIKLFSSTSDKDFFLELAKYTKENQTAKTPTDYLKVLENENIDDKINNHFIHKSDEDLDVNIFEVLKKDSFNTGYETKNKIIENMKNSKMDSLAKLNEELEKTEKLGINKTVGGLNKNNLKIKKSIFNYNENDLNSKNSESNTLLHHFQNDSLEKQVNKQVKRCNLDTDIDAMKNKVDDQINVNSHKSNKDELIASIEKSNSSSLNNKEDTVEKLLKFGINLNHFKSKADGSTILDDLNWDTDVAPLIKFMKEQAQFTEKQLVKIFSTCPRIFKTSIRDIQNLFDFFNKRKLKITEISALFYIKPSLLIMNVKDLETRLLKLEQFTTLTMLEINQLIIASPSVLSENILKLQACLHHLKIGMGFTEKEIQKILLSSPGILLQNLENINQNFIFLHRTLKMSYEDIANCGNALAMPRSTLIERVKYLMSLNKYQINSIQDSCHKSKSITKTNDEEFSKHVAQTPFNQFREFIKTL